MGRNMTMEDSIVRWHMMKYLKVASIAYMLMKTSHMSALDALLAIWRDEGYERFTDEESEYFLSPADEIAKHLQLSWHEKTKPMNKVLPYDEIIDVRFLSSTFETIVMVTGLSTSLVRRTYLGNRTWIVENLAKLEDMNCCEAAKAISMKGGMGFHMDETHKNTINRWMSIARNTEESIRLIDEFIESRTGRS